MQVGEEQQEFSVIAGGNPKWHSTTEDSMVSSSQIKHTHTMQASTHFTILIRMN
jgi:hypothetical protein